MEQESFDELEQRLSRLSQHTDPTIRLVADALTAALVNDFRPHVVEVVNDFLRNLEQRLSA